MSRGEVSRGEVSSLLRKNNLFSNKKQKHAHTRQNDCFSKTCSKKRAHTRKHIWFVSKKCSPSWLTKTTFSILQSQSGQNELILKI